MIAKRIAGRFIVEREVGAGGMGTVFLAHDRVDNRQVAVKVLRASGGSDLKRFNREATLLAELVHPGIVGYVSHGELADGRPYLVTDWIEGGSLADRIDNVGLSPREALAVTRRITMALEPVHLRGLVHRDIKPSNIMVPNGSLDDAILIDFGVARAFGDDATRMTATGMTVGTPGYMAPEQIRGLVDVDSRTDVFALGCVLYECLTGVSPFWGGNALAVHMKILVGDPPSLAVQCPEAPTQLCMLVERMLSKDPEMRPFDAGLLRSSLAAFHDLPDQPRRRPPTIPAVGDATSILTTLHRVRLSQERPSADRRGVIIATRLGGEYATVPDEVVVRLSAAGADVDRLERGAVLATITANDDKVWALANEVCAAWPGASVAVSFMDGDDVDSAIERASATLAAARDAGVYAAESERKPA